MLDKLNTDFKILAALFISGICMGISIMTLIFHQKILPEMGTLGFVMEVAGFMGAIISCFGFGEYLLRKLRIADLCMEKLGL